MAEKEAKQEIIPPKDDAVEKTPNINIEVNDILTPTVMEYLSKYIGYEWALLAYNLGLTREDIAQVENKNKEHKTKVCQMLLLWLNKHKEDHRRLRSFVSALDLCGRKDLGQKIHCAQWAEQNFQGLDMPSTFPMLVRINKVKPKSSAVKMPKINDLNPTSCVPVHSLNPKFIQVM